MSIVYCEDCGQQIDTDFDAEHFDTPHLDESEDMDLTALDEAGKNKICQVCGGQGGDKENGPFCPNCNGTGEID